MLVLALAMWFAPSVAHASDAEVKRLQDEVRKLARQTHWSGVDRVYRRLAGLDTPSAEMARIGADAARELGDVHAWRERMVTLDRWEPGGEAAATVARIDAGYGAVVVSAPAPLVRAERSFAPDANRAADAAAARVESGTAFIGLLPVGAYTAGGRAFEVEAGQPWTLETGSRAVVVAAPQGSAALSPPRWQGQEVTFGELAPVLRTVPAAADALRAGTVLQAAGGGALGVGLGLAIPAMMLASGASYTDPLGYCTPNRALGDVCLTGARGPAIGMSFASALLVGGGAAGLGLGSGGRRRAVALYNEQI